MARAYPDVVLRRNVHNQSARSGGSPDLIVVHSTESHNRPGKGDLAAIAAWFDNPAAQASAHVCVDADGHSARLVGDEAKAWACVSFNSRSLNIEQIGFAAQGRWSSAEIDETARWLAYWSAKYRIPLVHSTGRTSGVTRHMDLGAAGGNHHDPGANFPLSKLLDRARHFKRLQQGR